MKIKLIAVPMTIVLRPGTYQGTLEYWPVQPSQKMPTTRSGEPSIAPKRRCSGGGKPFHFAMSAG